jgi:hypothetical protein
MNDVKEELVVATLETVKSYPGVICLAGDSRSVYIYIVPNKLAPMAGVSLNHFENPVCFWIVVDAEIKKIRLMAGVNPRLHTSRQLVIDPRYWDSTILDSGEKDDWKENVRVKVSIPWADLYNIKDPIKRKDEINRLMGELKNKLLPRLKYILIK